MRDAARFTKTGWGLLALGLALFVSAGAPGAGGSGEPGDRLLVLDGGSVTAIDPETLAPRRAHRADRRRARETLSIATGNAAARWRVEGGALALENEAGHELLRLEPEGEVRALASDPAGLLLWSVEGPELVLRDLVSGHLLRRQPLPPLEPPLRLAPAPDVESAWLVAGGVVLTWDGRSSPRRMDLPPVDAFRVGQGSSAWALAGGELYSLSATAEPVPVSLPRELSGRSWVDLETRAGTLWLTDGERVARFDPADGRLVLAEGPVRGTALRWPAADRSAPRVEWSPPVEAPRPGSLVELALVVDERGSGVDPSGVELRSNGRTMADACDRGARGTLACAFTARYVRGRLVVEAAVTDRAGNRSRRLRASWTNEDGSSREATTVEATLAASADAHLSVASPNGNHGAAQRLSLRRGGFDRPLLRFDLNGVAGDVEVLHGAYLELDILDNRDDWGAGRWVDAHRATAAWTELGATWNCPSDSNANNAQADCAPPWWGGDPAADPTDSVLHTNGLGGRVSFDVTQDVLAFLAGEPNHGWLLRHGADGTGTVRYASREHDPGLAPSLRLIFEPAAPPDETPPTVEFISPHEGEVLTDDRPTLHIAIGDEESGVDESTLRFHANGVAVVAICQRGLDLFCSLEEALPSGLVTLAATVEDLSGNVSQPAEVTVTVAVAGPPPVDTLLTSAGLPVAGVTSVTGLPEAAQPETTLTAINPAAAVEVTAPVAPDGGFGFDIVAEPGDVLTLVLTDGSGRESDPASLLVPVPGMCHSPPDPVLLAPDTTVLNFDLYRHNRFLWESEPPVQAGVVAGALTAENTALARGRVVDRDGLPLPGVSVGVLGRPELGCTASRVDGSFDLAFSGGTVVLEFDREGYFSAQRRLTLPFGRQRTLADVALTPWPDGATTIESGREQVQVARGEVETDANGTRRATLLVPEGVSAELVLPDGSVQPAPGLTLRIREFTVGDDGPEAMPGTLPSASAYTYAFEATADEAEALDASIAFSQPVYKYLENYLDFPVGYAMPVGYYDNRAGVWVPSPNGVVLRILAVDSLGRAEVDVVGEGEPADAATLASLGFTDAERVELASLYAVGDELWRTPIPHLTPYDCNAPWLFSPADAISPDPEVTGGLGERCSDQAAGSIIECQNQVFRESIPLAGTPFALHYSSERVPGREFGRSVEIVLTPEEIPDSLQKVLLEIEVVGRKFESSYPPAPNLTEVFVWDGLDAYGRPVIGGVLLEGRVGFVYPMDFSSSSGDPGFGLPPGSNVSVRRALEQLIVWADFSVTLEALNFGQAGGQLGLGLAGWSLTPQHVHTPRARASGELHFGNGGRRPSHLLQADDEPLLSSHVLAWIWQGDAWVQANVPVPDIRGLAVDADGNLYFTTGAGYAVYVRRESGEVYRLAGGGSATSWDDGVPAVTALLNRPERVAVGPDGSLYIAEVNGDRIRRVLPAERLEERRIETVAEVDAPMDVSIGPDGGLYTAVYVPGSAHRILRVDLQSGETGIYAGGYGPACQQPDRGDGGTAVRACLILASSHILQMAWMEDGSLLIPEGGGAVHASRIRRVWPDGSIDTFMGDDTQADPSYGQHYTNSSLRNPVYLAVDPATGHVGIVDGSVNLGAGRLSLIVDGEILVLGAFPASHVAFALDGSLYWAQDPLGTQGTEIFRRRPSEIGESDGGFRVPSPDGSEIYLFTAEGRHLETVDAITGHLVHRFLYDGAGRLLEIEDRYGEKVTVGYDAQGDPASIAGPNGQVTLLEVDDEERLTRVTNPEGESWTFEYGAGELLEVVTNPRGYGKRLTYDDLGRLFSHQDAKNAVKTLTRSSGTTEYDVALLSAEGHETRFEVVRLPDGSQSRTRTAADEITTATLLREDLSRLEILPDGTTVDLQFSEDSRFGLRAPMPQIAVTTPVGALTRTTSVERSFTLVDPTGSPWDPLNLETYSEEVAVNGKTYSSVYTAADRRWRLTSPEGRVFTSWLDENGEVERVERPGALPVTLEYDERGRLVETRTGTGSEERITRMAYEPVEGWLESIVDAEQRVFSWERDFVGRPERTDYPDDRSLDAVFDENGSVVALAPPERPPHAFEYDEVDLPASYVAPGNPAESYAFDLDGKPDLLTLPSGKTVAWRYDNAHRLDSIETHDDDYDFAYVPGTRRVQSISRQPSGDGDDVVQTLAYSYDGLLPTGTAWSGSITGTVDQAYDHDFRVVSQRVNGDWEVGYEYDLDSLIVRAGDLDVLRDSASGRIDGTALGAVVTARGYNDFGELDSLGASTVAGSLYAASYERDRLGRITRKEETLGGVTATYDYAYDLGGRLDTVHRDGVLVEDYGYDANDNRTSYSGLFGSATGSYDAQDRLQSYGGANYTFDEDGYLRSISSGGHTTTYDYDVMGSLRKVVLDTGITIEYLVDGQNRRVGKLIDGVLVQGFLYQDQLNPVAELDGDGNVVARFVYATRAHVPDYMVTPTATYRLITDHLGSVRLVVDTQTGAIAQRLDYDSFGRITYNSNPTFQPFGFAGGLHDPQTGLVRFGARDYAPIVGRWTAKDPIGFLGGDPNLYGYVQQDPVNVVDPSGKAAPAVAALLVLAWGGLELGLSAYDVYDTIATVTDPCSGADDIALSLTGLGVGLVAPGGGYGVGAKAGKTLVIGRGADLAKPNAIRPGEFKLEWPSLLPDFRSEWKRNSGLLRQYMKSGRPIRDASPKDKNGLFLNAERFLLESRGWTFNKKTGYWMPPQ